MYYLGWFNFFYKSVALEFCLRQEVESYENKYTRIDVAQMEYVKSMLWLICANLDSLARNALVICSMWTIYDWHCVKLNLTGRINNVGIYHLINYTEVHFRNYYVVYINEKIFSLW